MEQGGSRVQQNSVWLVATRPVGGVRLTSNASIGCHGRRLTATMSMAKKWDDFHVVARVLTVTSMRLAVPGMANRPEVAS